MLDTLKIILLTSWCIIGLMIHFLADGEEKKYNFTAKLWNTMIWVVFICWFYYAA